MSISKTELRSMQAELALPFGSEMSKDDLIKNLSDALINEQVETAGQVLFLIENEENADD